MTPRERAEELVADYLAALEQGGAAPFEAWLAGEPVDVRVEAESIHRALGEVLGDLGVETGLETADDDATLPTGGGPLPPAGMAALDAEPDPGTAGPWRYDVGDEIGRGGNGSVREVFDRELRRRLAMKVLAPDSDPVLAARRRARFK
ncbi:MAG: hypothetical protein AAFZ65_10010, partial [Planctomycetota bacterium]